jgi:hypothetical protein
MLRPKRKLFLSVAWMHTLMCAFWSRFEVPQISPPLRYIYTPWLPVLSSSKRHRSCDSHWALGREDRDLSGLFSDGRLSLVSFLDDYQVRRLPLTSVF